MWHNLNGSADVQHRMDLCLKSVHESETFFTLHCRECNVLHWSQKKKKESPREPIHNMFSRFVKIQHNTHWVLLKTAKQVVRFGISNSQICPPRIQNCKNQTSGSEVVFVCSFCCYLFILFIYEGVGGGGAGFNSWHPIKTVLFKPLGYQCLETVHAASSASPRETEAVSTSLS